MRISQYAPDRRADVADLLGRVWGTSPSPGELGWLYEQNPVRQASVLLGEEDGRVVGLVAMSFVRMAIAGEELEVGMPVHLATDPGFRGRGIFAELQARNEEHARELGLELLLIVPNAVSAPILTGRLGWRPLEPVRIWARMKLLAGRPRAPEVDRFTGDMAAPDTAGRDRVLRDASWLNWRFVDSPTRYRALGRDGYAVSGRRGRLGVVAVVDGDLVGDAVRAAGGPLVIAAPPPGHRNRYLAAGFLPTQRRLAVLGKALDPGRQLPERPHFELGDLDFV